MFKDPVKWAAAASAQFGFLHALGIANSCKGPIGVDGSAPNPMAAYWTNAFNWLKNRAPKESLEDLARRIQAAESAKMALKTYVAQSRGEQ